MGKKRCNFSFGTKEYHISGKILKEIATKCYYTEYFKWDQSKRILQYIKENYKMTKNFILIPMNGGYERNLVAAIFLQNNNLTPC